MNLNIARQPLVPAFVTLVALAALTMWSAGIPAAPDSGSGAFSGTLPLLSPAEWLMRFQTACPGWSRWIGTLLLLFTGMSTGRLTVRYNLYSVGTCLAIPLYAAIAGGVSAGFISLPALAASALLALAAKNYGRSFCNGYGFDSLFRASLYLGCLPFIIAASLPLVVMLPLAVTLFRRTLREAAVAVAGLLLPAFTLCYLNWGVGGEFAAPLAHLAEAWMSGPALTTLLALPIRNLVLLGDILLLDLIAILYFFSDSYALGTKPRSIFLFQIFQLLLTVATLCNPAATPDVILLTAAPSAVLLPFLFVRIHRLPALILYLILLAGVVANLCLQ